MTPRRIQRERSRGWTAPLDAEGRKPLYVGRGTRWGNPYRAIRGTVYGPRRPIDGGELVAYSTHGPASDAVVAAVEMFRADIDCAIRSPLTADLIRAELAGRDLMCWCAESVPCHADVLLAIANRRASR